MDLESLKFWVDVIWKAGTVVVLVWLALKQKSAANATAIGQLSEHLVRIDGRLSAIETLEAEIRDRAREIQAHDVRLARVEAWKELAPSRADLEKIHARISEGRNATADLGRETAALKAVAEAIQSKVTLLDRHHYEEGRK